MLDLDDGPPLDLSAKCSTANLALLDADATVDLDLYGDLGGVSGISSHDLGEMRDLNDQPFILEIVAADHEGGVLTVYVL